MGVKLQLKVKVEAAALLQERYRIYNSLFLPSTASRLKVKRERRHGTTWCTAGLSHRCQKEAIGTETSTSQPVAPRHTAGRRGNSRRAFQSRDGGLQWRPYHERILRRGHQER
ncbi:hypothetical protein NC651_013580 [Populus alba x Populus x berolinensis]|nr:hypothetical protein NC651_013580 [Populus alba x Populus x berolinensis]